MLSVIQNTVLGILIYVTFKASELFNKKSPNKWKYFQFLQK